MYDRSTTAGIVVAGAPVDVTLAPSDLHLVVVKCYGPINNLHTEMDTFCGDMTLQKHDTIEQCYVTLETRGQTRARDT